MKERNEWEWETENKKEVKSKENVRKKPKKWERTTQV